MPNILQQVKDVARNPYAWPGGYPRFLVMSDGECLCPKCVRSEFRQIVRAALLGLRDGWKPEGGDINWEDNTLFCAHCNERIPSAYAEEESYLRPIT